jgi:predicted ATPase
MAAGPGSRSQIRDSTINNLLEKVAKRSYGKYLVKLTLAKVRGFTDRMVSFDFPVTALIGPNGGGKTTILGAAATAYSGIRPRQFFTKSGKFDSSMANWRIEYELIDRDINKGDSFRRTAAFLSQKWSRDAVPREVVVFGVSRTVPAGERKELQRCASGTFKVDPSKIEAMKDSVAKAVEKILGKDISKYTHIKVDEKGRVSLLTGETGDGTQYSEFHFGAGESSIIRMVMQIEALEPNCLILIEEIENGLHPVATARMVEYLIEVAERKSAQAIFTTHSNEALRPLPAKAIWAAIGGQVFQGKLDIAALRAISGQIEAQLALFCEDEFAANWIRAILRSQPDVAQEGIEIHAMAGDGAAVKVNKHHNLDPSSKFPSVCLIDGDSAQYESASERVFRLPGQTPETHVLDMVLDKVAEYGGVLAVRLMQSYSSADRVARFLEEIRRANRDPHVLYSQVGYRLGLIPESTVRDAVVTTWAEAYPEHCAALLTSFEALLPREAANKAQIGDIAMMPK